MPAAAPKSAAPALRAVAAPPAILDPAAAGVSRAWARLAAAWAGLRAAGGLGLRAWHLLSLDAPTVAAFWAWSVARWFRAPLSPWAIPLLALATWLLYVADRILDGFGPGPLQQRHIFHRRHGRAFLLSGGLAAAVLVWASLTRLPQPLLRGYLILGLFALLDLVLVHLRRPVIGRFLPKEFVVGLVFALAVALPAWSAAPLAVRPSLAAAAALFAAVCWLNCAAIEGWESPSPFSSQRLSVAAVLLAACAFAALALAALDHRAPLLHPAAAVFISALIFFGLDRARARLSPLFLRIAADAALLTPLLWLRW